MLRRWPSGFWPLRDFPECLTGISGANNTHRSERDEMYTEIPVKDGIATGRNGTYDICSVVLSEVGENVRLDARSLKRGIVLNGGISMDRRAALELANDIIRFVAPA